MPALEQIHNWKPTVELAPLVCPKKDFPLNKEERITTKRTLARSFSGMLLFMSCAPEFLEALARMGRSRTYMPGQTLAVAGHRDSRLVIVTGGIARACAGVRDQCVLYFLWDGWGWAGRLAAPSALRGPSYAAALGRSSISAASCWFKRTGSGGNI